MVEPESGGVRTVVWAEVCPWLSILRCFRLAISLRVLVFGAAGIFLTLAGWWVLGNLFYAERAFTQWQTRWSDNTLGGGRRPSAVRHRSSGWSGVHACSLSGMGGPFGTTWAELSRPMRLALITPRLDVGSATFLLLAGFLDVGGLGVLRRGHQPHRGGPIGRRRAGRLGRGAAVRPAKVALLFRRPLAPLAGSPRGRGPVGNSGAAHARERSASSRSA